jgi:hypothetical protein
MQVFIQTEAGSLKKIRNERRSRFVLITMGADGLNVDGIPLAVRHGSNREMPTRRVDGTVR